MALRIPSVTSESKNYTGHMRVTSKGQVTIPRDLRERHGLMPETEVRFIERDGAVVIEQATATKADRGDRLIATMRSGGPIRLSTDEIMRLTRSMDDPE
jgi:AbrB family looped-hinge helix DNA binding protein